RSSDVLSFGEMELRVLSDCSEGLCAPIHTITWGDGETLELTPEQLSEPIERVTICDLDRDGDLELALTSASCGSGRYGEFLLLEWTEGAWKAHNLCEVADSNLKGCMGHQRITVWEDHVEVAFPLYAVDDPNCCPTDGSRSLSYVYEGDSFKLSESIEGPPSQAMGWNG
ncbi:MAG: hypothetical protein OSB14_06090, partial [Planctomycetota bacterium]|nr:hypothetical protein [Planctomycetota bacterium]